MSQRSDQNLLFAILALQMHFVDRDELVAAMNQWAERPGESLGAILVEQGALGDSERALLEMAVQNRLAKRGSAEDSVFDSQAAATVIDLLDDVTDRDFADSLSPSVTETAAAQPETSRSDRPSSPTQRFRPLRSFARGGLGEVFVAHDEELHRDVALKEIRPEYADQPELRERFVLEAEITGRLEHPGIVPVYGLGVYPDGRPFYAMRFIRGESLQESIRRFHDEDAQAKTPGQRILELRNLLRRFVDVCYAVAFAHSRGVIHRDLKPDNVMLGPYGETLLVDWGLAKLVPRDREKTVDDDELREKDQPEMSTLRPKAAGRMTATEIGSAVGTPAYMSPEQAAGLVDQLGPASDIYGLGATLYAVLTGQPPVCGGRLEELQHAVMTGKFPPPRKVNADASPALEAVALKAMSLDPDRRYQSARDVAGEIEAWLADEPVRAWREPLRVRAGRWMRRHRSVVSGAVTAALVVLVSLSVGIVLLTAANENVRRAKAEAEKREEEAQRNFEMANAAVEKYLTRVSDDPRLQGYGLEPLRRDLLDTAREFYEQFVQQKPDDPELQAQRAWAYFRLAGITTEIGSKSDAIELLSKARDAFEALSKQHPDRIEYGSALVKTHTNIALLHIESGRNQQAMDSLLAALKISKDIVRREPDNPACQADLANVHHNLAKIYVDAKDFEQTETAYKAAIAIRKELARSHPESLDYQSELAASQSNLGLLHHLRDQHDLAEQSLLSARSIQQRLVEQDAKVPNYRSDLAATCNNLAVLYAESPDRFEDAEKAYKTAIEVEQGLADEHRYVLQYQRDLARWHNNLATLYCTHDRFPEAEASYRAAKEVHQKLASQHPELPDHQQDLASTLNNLGNLYGDTDRLPEAEEAYREAIKIAQRLVGMYPKDPDCRSQLANIYNNLGTLLTQTSRLDEADVAYRAAIKARERLRTEHPKVVGYAIGLSTTYANAVRLSLELDRPQTALDYGLEAIAILQTAIPPDREDFAVRRTLRNAHWGCAEALARLGRHKEALDHWTKALEMGEAREPLRLGRAESLALSGDHAAAVAEAQQLLDAAEGVGPVLYRLAVIHAVAREAVENDDSIASKDRTPLVDQYSRAAVEILKRARKAGYFENEEHLRLLQEDDVWQPIQGRDDFRELLKQLEQ